MLFKTSPLQHFEAFEKKFQKAFSAKNQKQMTAIFCAEFNYQLKIRARVYLAKLFHSYLDLDMIEDKVRIIELLTLPAMKETAMMLLDENEFEDIGLKICKMFEI